MFVNLVRFPPVLEGHEAAFLEWFKRSNDVYREFPGFVSRRLQRAADGRYAAVVEHERVDVHGDAHIPVTGDHVG